MQQHPVLVIGVDFGTTFSGFSYALWDANKEITKGCECC